MGVSGRSKATTASSVTLPLAEGSGEAVPLGAVGNGDELGRS